MSALPAGTLTFLFTDIEGSTRLLQELGDAYESVQDVHSAVLRKAISRFEGVVIRTEGDSFFAVFRSPSRPFEPRSRLSESSRPRIGRTASRSGSGWGCTPARGGWAATTTSAST